MGRQAEEELHPPEPENVGAWFSNPGGLATASAGFQVCYLDPVQYRDAGNDGLKMLRFMPVLEQLLLPNA